MAVQLPDMNLMLLLPEILIALLAMVLLLMSAWMGKEGRGLIGTLAIGGVVMVGIIMAGLYTSGSATTFGGLFIADDLAYFMKVLLLISTALPLLMSRDYLLRNGLDSGEYFVLSLFALLGGMTMVSAGNFMVLYLGLELMSLSI